MSETTLGAFFRRAKEIGLKITPQCTAIFQELLEAKDHPTADDIYKRIVTMALKAEMVKRARTINHDFAFWNENFSITQRSREEGYNIVFGFCWIDQHHPDRMKNLARQLAREGFPIPFFSTPEKLEIGDIPFIASHEKPTRRDGLLYYRRVVEHFGLDARPGEEVTAVTRTPDGKFLARVMRRHETISYLADNIVFATGYY